MRLASVIESASEFAGSSHYIERLSCTFRDVMKNHKYAKDIDPLCRGPFGTAKIDLKDHAKPMKKRFFRCSGEREEALELLITKMIKNG